MTFENFSPELRKLIKEKGFMEPTLPQKMGIPEIMKGKNVLILAPTGHGKTEAACLGLFDKLHREKHPPISVLYINPLRALSRDLLDRLFWWGDRLGIEIAVRHGDTTKTERSEQSDHPPHMLITTPETLGVMLVSRKIREHLKNVKHVIVDEVHELAGNKRGVHLSILMERLRNLCGTFQTIGLSATVGHPEKIALTLSPDIKIIRAEADKKYDIKVEVPEFKDGRAEELFVSESTLARMLRIRDLVDKHKSVLIFTNTRQTAEVLSSRFAALDREMKQEVYHGSLSREKRLESEKRFKSQQIKSLICLSKGTRLLLQNGKWQPIESLSHHAEIVGVDKNLKASGCHGKGIVNKGIQDIVELKTSLGFNISCTPEHLFLTLDRSKGIYWKKLKDFSINDPVAIIRKVPVKCRDFEFISQLPKDIYVKLSKPDIEKIKYAIKERYSTYERMANNTGISKNLLGSFLSSCKAVRMDSFESLLYKLNFDIKDFKPETIGAKNYPRYKIPDFVSADFCRFVGFFLADGASTKNNNSIRLFNKNLILLHNYTKIIKKEFGAASKFAISKDGVNISIIHMTWLQKLFSKWKIPLGRKAKTVRIPEIIFELPESHRASFLAGYFDGDGNYEYKNEKLVGMHFNTFSRGMAEDLQKLLMSIGCLSSNRARKPQGHVVSLLGGEHLRNALKLCDLFKVPKFPPVENGYSNQDTIPNAGKMLYKLRKGLEISTYQMQKLHLNPYRYEKNQRSISRHELEKLMKIYNIKNQELEKLVNSDIFWDFIVEINPKGRNEVFDVIDVSPDNCFIAEGFVTHNCTSSLELGIDIGSIDLVIQYMSPRQVSKFIQRVGRGGHRIGEKSFGIILSGDDDIFESAVIARKAMSKELEEIRVHEGALDVLAMQVIGMAIEEYGISSEKIYETVRRSYHFRMLSKEKFNELMKFLAMMRLVFLDPMPAGWSVKRSRKGFQFHFENLSTIPDTKQLRVISIVENEPVGNLDEAFVAEHGEPGSTFIVGGRAWKIVQVEEKRVIVEPVDDVESAIPAWEGELIPVPFDVAQEVGSLRNGIDLKKYPLDQNALKEMKKILGKQDFMPSNDEFLVEDYKDFIIIHSCCGTMINDTIARYIAAEITANTGISVNIKNDPYRIMLQTMTKPDEVMKILRKPDKIRETLELAISQSSLFKYRFLHVARRFGVISKAARFDRLSMSKVISQFNGTPVYDETVREIFLDKMDIEGAERVMKKISGGEIKLKYRKGLSHLGELGLAHHFSEVMKPRRPEGEIFKAFQRRLMHTRVRIACTKCWDYSVMKEVKDFDDQPACPKCHSVMIAVTRGRREIDRKKMDKKELGELVRSADLVATYGKKYILTRAGIGVGVETAARILARLPKDDEQLLKYIYEEEKTFARTKIYWKA